MTYIVENGKRYLIEDGQVVSASVDAPEYNPELRDKVISNGKVGQVVGLSPSIYGTSAAIQYDDGSFDEVLAGGLELAPYDKTASTKVGFEGEYEEYLSLPEETAQEIAYKRNKARELHAFAKDAISTADDFADQMLYQRVATDTQVDLMELETAHNVAEAEENNYLLRQPKFVSKVATSSLSYGMHKGDASWLENSADEFTASVSPLEDSELAEKASATVAGLNAEQLADPNFMKNVLDFSLTTVPEEKRARFASFISEARADKLGSENVHTASVESYSDLDGNKIELDNIPLEAIFGA